MANHESPFPPAETIGGLEALIGREHVSEDYVRFRIELLKAQTAVLARLAGSDCLPPPQAAGANKAVRTGALDPGELPLDRGLLADLLEAFFQSLEKRPQPNPELARLRQVEAEVPELPELLARAAAFGPDPNLLAQFSRTWQIDFETLLLVGRVLAAPFVTEAVRRLKRRDPQPRPSSGHCPFCGSPPGLAMLRGEAGKRVLGCSLCGETWPLARLRCPFCENEGGLNLLRFEENDPRFIEACDRCPGYLKTVDQRRLPDDQPVIPLVETVATLYLDLIAEEKGYAKSVPYAALR